MAIVINGSGTVTGITGDLTLDAGGDIVIDADGGDIKFKDAGTHIGSISNSSSDFLIESKVSDKDIVFKGNDGGSDVTAMTIDMSAGGNVGIGRSPLALLHLQATVPELRFTYTGNSGYAHIKSNGDSELIFSTGTTDGQERMRIDSTGAVTMPAQPAFHVASTASQVNVSVNTEHVVNFASEIFDVGSNFAANYFTAPVTGKYFLTTTTRIDDIDDAAEFYQLRITTSNRFCYSLIDPDTGQDTNYWHLSLNVLTDMDAGDTAYVGFYQSGGAAQTDIDGDPKYTNFSGYLVA